MMRADTHIVWLWMRKGDGSCTSEKISTRQQKKKKREHTVESNKKGQDAFGRKRHVHAKAQRAKEKSTG